MIGGEFSPHSYIIIHVDKDDKPISILCCGKDLTKLISNNEEIVNVNLIFSYFDGNSFDYEIRIEKESKL